METNNQYQVMISLQIGGGGNNWNTIFTMLFNTLLQDLW